MSEEKILIIDDNPMNLELVSDLLELHGFLVIKAKDSKTGMELAQTEKPDLILMDIQLPGIDGIDATRILKEDIITADIPIVALTAHAMKGDEEKILKAGCTGYISKPINTREFPKIVKSYLKKTT
ncbi:MAG: two-component system response regulator [Planctomycetes bacterium GWA2_40_7]|nr:MAG: two-component system response regulator [Planctomycetes bacterium GWA2_40_7]OHB74151.1 MAG: two-component system response regulator [Planctomycetes bacterium RBG_16_41_13]